MKNRILALLASLLVIGGGITVATVPNYNSGVPQIVHAVPMPIVIPHQDKAKLTATTLATAPLGITPFQGETLTTSNGTWTNNPTSFTYQWQDCTAAGTGCTNIGGATAQSYVVQAADVGHTIVVVVTAHNSAGTGSNASAPTGIVTAGGSTFSISVNDTTGKFVDGSGNPLQLYGVNVTGTEDQCVQNGTFGLAPYLNTVTTSNLGPLTSAANLLKSFSSPQMNAVRVPLNEACWLGIGGVAGAVAGTNYQIMVKAWVAALNAAGIYAILDLHWVYPPDGGNSAANEEGQWPMTDTANSITFWEQVATTFNTFTGVVFDPYNEPYPDTNNNGQPNYTCWLSGCTNSTSFQIAEGSSGLGGQTIAYSVAGFQSMVNALRSGVASNGSDQPILLEGASFGADPCRSEQLGGNGNCASASQFQNLPTDPGPTKQLALNIHVYEGKGGCNATANTTCWGLWLTAANAAKLPSVITELGAQTNSDSYYTSLFSWAQSNNVGWTAWSWQGCGQNYIITGGSNCTTATPSSFGSQVQSAINSAITANN